jgi:2-phospho-L-lactate guanylyltransferase
VSAVWIAVVPVKRLESAKTRLRGALPGVAHDRLVLALVQDTVAAVLACPDVADLMVVTSEPAMAGVVTALGGRVVPDAPEAGLNPAFAHGARLAGDRPVVALAGDLPALRPAELSAALAATAGRRAFVPDAAGTGTTLLAAPAGTALDPRFGPGSAAAHAGSGATTLDGPWPSLRHDVDTAADLAAAAAIGLGTRTEALYRLREVRPEHRLRGTEPEHRLRGARPEPGSGARERAQRRSGTRYRAGMQGTVASYDPDGRFGTVLLDDGTELSFPATAFDASGLRLLRPGQRVRLEQSDGEVTALALVTMPGSVG